ncbi:hypothetical protein FACS1894170_00530 [Planctomycetales bacterium]|nr:hypothetical protein FACS1894170_00530 [Planctomycetales bacterium]
MAKEAKKEPEPVVEAPEAAAPPQSYRLQILLGLAGLILFQMIVLWLLLPSRQVVEANLGIDPVNGTAGYEAPNVLPPDIGKKEPMVEKPISEKPFKVKETKADSETTETFTVTIHAKIRKKDERAFDARYLGCQFEIIDAVTTALQGSTSDDRRSVGLTNIKEKVKKAINDVLGTPYIQEILTQDPSLESQ